jgi:tetratricopeptide (TPR) repeat protein
LDAGVYPNEEVASLLNKNFVAAKVNVVENEKTAKEFNIHWTPTILVLDKDKKINFWLDAGYQPATEFIPTILISLGRYNFNSAGYDTAVQWFSEVVDKHSSSLSIASALYWRGVSFYKKGDKDNLIKNWTELLSKYPKSRWAQAVSFIQQKK